MRFTRLNMLGAGLALLGLTASAFAVPVDQTKPLVTLLLYHTSDCSDDAQVLNLHADVCAPMADVSALRVVYYDKGLSYNSLRTFDIDDCGGGWSLQPLIEDCFQYVKTDRSVQVYPGNDN